MRIVMMGTGLFAEPTFEKLLASTQVVSLFTQPDRAVVGEQCAAMRETDLGRIGARITARDPECLANRHHRAKIHI